MCVGLNRDPAGGGDWLSPPYIEGIVFAQARDVDGHCMRIAASEPLRRGRGVVNLVESRSRSHRFLSISAFNTSVATDRTAACPAALLAERRTSRLPASVTAGSGSRGDLANHAQASAAALGTGPLRRILGPRRVGDSCLLRFDRRADLSQTAASTGIGQEAEMSDSHESFR